jgi:Tol biopolymer transport system component
VWRFDVARGVATPVTNSIESEFASIWLKDGKSIVYSKRVGPAPQIFLRNLETAEERQLAPTAGFQRAMSISADGRTLSFDERKAGGSFQAWTLPLDGGKPSPFGVPATSAPPALTARDQNTVISSSRELRYSPDGRVVAVFGADTGRPELYVAPVSSPAARVRVSTQGAADMQFSRDGSELFYLSFDDQMMAVPIRSSPSVEAGRPRALFRVDPARPWIGFDVAPDGRFLAIVEEVSGRKQPATVAVNWTPELR